MAYNLVLCNREQGYLMPPSLREWLAGGHLAWFIVDAVEEIDLREPYARYWEDGWGAAAYDPAMMVAVLLYAYCQGTRSSRRIARPLEEDVGFRVVAANQQPDFRTIAAFAQSTRRPWKGCLGRRAPRRAGAAALPAPGSPGGTGLRPGEGGAGLPAVDAAGAGWGLQ